MFSTVLRKDVPWLLTALVLSLTGCGLTQTVKDGAVSAAQAIFTKKVTVLRLDFSAREALNTDARENNSLSEPLVVRVYQLKDRKTLDGMVYQQLAEEDERLLKESLLASRSLVLKPGGSVSLTMPIETESQFVAVVGFFRHPDMAKNSWKMVLGREELNPDAPRLIDAGGQALTLRVTWWIKRSVTVITGHRGRLPKLRLWNNTMVSCLPVKSGNGLAGLPMGWPGLLSFQVCPVA